MREWIVSRPNEATKDMLRDAFCTGELIRCKDCKYWLPHSKFGFDEDNEEYHNYCERLVPDDEYYAFTRNADDFCSRAERKEK